MFLDVNYLVFEIDFKKMGYSEPVQTNLTHQKRIFTTKLALTYPRYLLQKEGNRRRPHPLQGMNRRKSRDFHINRDDQMNCQPDIESHKMGSKSV